MPTLAELRAKIAAREAHREQPREPRRAKRTAKTKPDYAESGRRGGKKSKKTITARQLRFVDEFLIDDNATQAALRAGYSKNTPGHEVMKKPLVAAEIARRRAKLSEKLEVTAERVLAEMAKVAFADIGDLCDENGELRPLHEIPEDTRRAISSLDVVVEDKDGLVRTAHRARMLDKQRALEALAKHLGLFEKDNEQGAGGALRELIEMAKNKNKGPPSLRPGFKKEMVEQEQDAGRELLALEHA